MQGGMWDQARELARQVGPKVEKEVNEAHRRSMAETGAAEDLVHSGNVAEGIEAYAQKGDWDKCREVAEQQVPRRDETLKPLTIPGPTHQHVS
jgi:hypothetical protein